MQTIPRVILVRLQRATLNDALTWGAIGFAALGVQLLLGFLLPSFGANVYFSYVTAETADVLVFCVGVQLLGMAAATMLAREGVESARNGLAKVVAAGCVACGAYMVRCARAGRACSAVFKSPNLLSRTHHNVMCTLDSSHTPVARRRAAALLAWLARRERADLFVRRRSAPSRAARLRHAARVDSTRQARGRRRRWSRRHRRPFWRCARRSFAYIRADILPSRRRRVWIGSVRRRGLSIVQTVGFSRCTYYLAGVGTQYSRYRAPTDADSCISQ